MGKKESKICITSKDLAEIDPALCSKVGSLPKPYKPVSSFIEGPVLNGRIEVFQPGQGVFLYILDLHCQNDIELSVSMNDPMVVFSLVLSGHYLQRIPRLNRGEKTFEFHSGSNNICRFQPEKSKFHLSSNKPHRIVDLQIDPTCVHELIDLDTPGIAEPTQALFRRSESRQGKRLPLNRQLENIANQVLQCNLQGVARQIFMQAKALEILAFEIDALSEPIKSSCYLKKRDREQLEMARLILHDEYINPPSLIQLAKRVGLNDFKLKRGFREAYNTTVFGYIRQLRMEKARDLLQTQELNVSEAALAVGYHCFGHFSAAFKKCFGTLPSMICPVRAK